MCLFPSAAAPLHIESATCRFWRKALIGVLALHLAIILLDFISFSWWDAILDILAFSIGYCAIREEDQYEVSRLLCYVMFMIFDFVFAGVKCCLFFAGVAGAPSGDKKNWQYYSYVVLVAGSTAFYLIGSMIAYRLYKALKMEVEGIGVAQPIDPANPGYGGRGYHPVANDEPAGPPPRDDGFKAFAGQGHTLGRGNGSSRTTAQTQPRAQQATPTSERSQMDARRQAAIDRLERKARSNNAPDS
uniref:Uncharacterized protein n=2 Tax=Lotharella globosa TaxID=91324 RepID=A0A6U3E1J9_9EUKA|mmetsp:Transcript_20555/g.41465  ORF Transcript_20555/g.41465 Transcript_20555/m.41465 type:complete len:245 (-) Transcript_20555:162-896(-)